MADAVKAIVNWERMTVCMDIYCSCGEQCHLDTWEAEQGSSQHLRCPYCSKVMRFGTEVALTETEVDYKVFHPRPHASFQWKGTEADLTATCKCGHEFAILDAFQYEVDCPSCRTHYHVWSDVTATYLTDEEAAAVAVIQEPEREDAY